MDRYLQVTIRDGTARRHRRHGIAGVLLHTGTTNGETQYAEQTFPLIKKR
jgi:hypothetical protein